MKYLILLTLIFSFSVKADNHNLEQTVWSWSPVTEDTNNEPIEIDKYELHRGWTDCDGVLTEEVFNIVSPIISYMEMTPPGTYVGLIITVSDDGEPSAPSETATKVIQCPVEPGDPPPVEKAIPKSANSFRVH